MNSEIAVDFGKNGGHEIGACRFCNLNIFSIVRLSIIISLILYFSKEPNCTKKNESGTGNEEISDLASSSETVVELTEDTREGLLPSGTCCCFITKL